MHRSPSRNEIGRFRWVLGCTEPVAHGGGWAVIQKNLHKMVIVEYAIAGCVLSILDFFSP
jgi:hypothetical protein